MLRHDGYNVRRASLSSLSVISRDSGRVSLRTVGEDRPETCFCCVLYFLPYRLLVNTQIFSYAFRRCNKRILSPSRFLHVYLLRALEIDVRAIVYNSSNESEN
nr:MAG TPA: hypothetical protein [Caudoviricetes sp.]